MATFNEEYENLLIFQYFDKPKFKAEISGIVSKFKEVFELQRSLESAFDIDTAIGKQLDIIGKIVGLPRKTNNIVPKRFFGYKNINIEAYNYGEGAYRNGRDSGYTALELVDSDYRFFLRAKIAINFMKNNIYSINEIIAYLFNNNAYVIDNKDTTFSIWLNENVQLRQYEYIKKLNLLPRPQTISYNNARQYFEDNTFGYRDINPNAKKYGEGKYAKGLLI